MKHSLFRSLRHKLINDGKLLRYLSYAIGEIILIVVGILFALKINDWNEDRKAQAEFDSYIEQLRQDVREALGNAIEASISSEEKIERGFQIVQFLEKEEYQPDELEAFESALGTLGKNSIPQIHVGLFGRLLDGSSEIISRDKNLSQQALMIESSIEHSLRTIDHAQILDNLCNAVFLKYRTLTRTNVPRLRVRYNLDELKASPEFLYATENSIQAGASIKGNSELISRELESFLTILEKY